MRSSLGPAGALILHFEHSGVRHMVNQLCAERGSKYGLGPEQIARVQRAVYSVYTNIHARAGRSSLQCQLPDWVEPSQVDELRATIKSAAIQIFEDAMVPVWIERVDRECEFASRSADARD